MSSVCSVNALIYDFLMFCGYKELTLTISPVKQVIGVPGSILSRGQSWLYLETSLLWGESAVCIGNTKCESPCRPESECHDTHVEARE